MNVKVLAGSMAALVAACTAVVGLAVPVGAVGAFKTPVRVSSATCSTVRIAAATGKTQHGFAHCDSDAITYVEGNGTKAWKQVRTSLKGGIVAVADDGTRTYLLYQSSKTTLGLAVRAHSGAITHRTLYRAKVATSFRGGIVAKGGKWWADWADYNGGSGHVWQAHTYKSVQQATRTKLLAAQVQLALKGSTVVMAWNGSDGVKIQVGSPSGAIGWTHSTVTQRFSTQLQLIIDGSKIGVAFVTTDAAYRNQVYWSLRSSTGKWSTKQLTSGSHLDPTYLVGASTGSTLALSWLSSNTAATVEVRRAGVWSHRTFSASQATVEAAAVPGGRALVVFSTRAKGYAQSRLEG